jgi:hypothetical protein
VFYFAGYTNAHDKSMALAVQVMALLGFGLDAIRQRYLVPERKVLDLLEWCRMWWHSEQEVRVPRSWRSKAWWEKRSPCR